MLVFARCLHSSQYSVVLKCTKKIGCQKLVSLPIYKKNIGCKKNKKLVAFLSTNRKGKKKWKEVNIPQLNSPLSHMVTKCKVV